jgi:hypothetical protein
VDEAADALVDAIRGRRNEFEAAGRAAEGLRYRIASAAKAAHVD